MSTKTKGLSASETYMAKVYAHSLQGGGRFGICFSISLPQCVRGISLSTSPLDHRQGRLVQMAHRVVCIVQILSNDREAHHCFQTPNGIFCRCPSHACGRDAPCFGLSKDRPKLIVRNGLLESRYSFKARPYTRCAICVVFRITLVKRTGESRSALTGSRRL